MQQLTAREVEETAQKKMLTVNEAKRWKPSEWEQKAQEVRAVRPALTSMTSAWWDGQDGHETLINKHGSEFMILWLDATDEESKNVWFESLMYTFKNEA